MGKAESTLSSMAGITADTSRKVDELSASSRSIQAIVGEIDKALEQFELAKAGPTARASALPRELRRVDHEAQPLPLSLGIVPVTDEGREEVLEALDAEAGPASAPGPVQEAGQQTGQEPGQKPAREPGQEPAEGQAESRISTSQGMAETGDSAQEELEELEAGDDG
jgi:hypothetical protein